MPPRRACITLFVLLLLTYAYVNQGGAANQNARLFMLQSMRYHNTLSIDEYHYKTIDKALYGGHFYPAQAPGTVFLAWPAFNLASTVLDRFGFSQDSSAKLLSVHWLTCIGSVGLLAALGGAFFFLLLTQWMSLRHALIAILGFFLGAAPFPYATQLFSHSAVIGLFSIALWLILYKRFKSSNIMVRFTLAGLLCGAAVSCEFPAVFPAGGIFIFILCTRPRLALPFAIGGAIPLLLVALHNVLIYDSPFAHGYTYTIHSDVDGGFFRALGVSAAWTLLGSPMRGLFFWSPIFLLIIPGCIYLWRDARSIFWLIVIPSILHTLFIMSFVASHGGYALGPRYLAPILPFLMIATARGFSRFPRLGVLLAIFSILLHGLGTLIWAGPPTKYLNPLAELYIPLILEGRIVAPNLGMLSGIPGLWSFTPVILWVSVLGFLLWRSLPRGAGEWS